MRHLQFEIEPFASTRGKEESNSGLLTSSKLSSICSNIVSGKSGPAAMWMVLQNKIWKSLAENAFFWFRFAGFVFRCFIIFSFVDCFEGTLYANLNRLNVIHLTRYQGIASFLLVFYDTQKKITILMCVFAGIWIATEIDCFYAELHTIKDN